MGLLLYFVKKGGVGGRSGDNVDILRTLKSTFLLDLWGFLKLPSNKTM